MNAERTVTRWRCVLAAAARLAGLYVIGVLVLLIPFMLMPYGGLPSLRDLAELGGLAVVPFAVAFLLLASARRAGVVTFWLLLGAVWAAAVAAHDLPIDLLIAFVGWSVVALPLHFLAAIGIPATLHVRIARARLSVPALVTILWALVLVPAVTIMYWSRRIMHPDANPIFILASDIAAFVWGPAPIVLIALSIAHAWRGTRTTRMSTPRTTESIGGRRRVLLALQMAVAFAATVGASVFIFAATRHTRSSGPHALIVHHPAPPAGMRIMRPDLSRLDAMPCFEARHADSTHHAGFPGLGQSPCEVGSADRKVTRSLGVW